MAILFAVDMCTRVEIYVITTYDSHKVLPKLYIINSTLNDWIIHREYTENGFETNEHTKKRNTHYEKGKKKQMNKKNINPAKQQQQQNTKANIAN